MRGAGGGSISLAALLILLAAPATAHAGMPFIGMDDVLQARADTISFFIFLILVLSLLVKLLWNYLARDFPKLPRMSYPRALAGVLLWGLLFLLVLTMISGARELMTPGAWEKQGVTYRLKDAPR